MSSNQLKSVADNLSKALKKQSTAHFNHNDYETIGDSFKSKDELFNQFDRSALLANLKSLYSTVHSSGKWVSTKSQMEYLCGMERDFRSRFRNRSDYFRSGSLNCNFTTASMDISSTIIDGIIQSSK